MWCKRNKIAILMFGLLLLCFSFFQDRLVLASEEEASMFMMDVGVSYGYDDNIKLGRFLPIKIKVNKPTSDVDASLSFELTDGMGSGYRYVYPMKLSKGKDCEKTYTIYIDKGSTEIDVRLYTGENENLYTKKIDLMNNSKSTTLLIGVLSDTPESLKYLDGVKLNYGLMDTKLVNLNAKDFPTDSVNLQQLDIIMISNYRIRNLSYDQSMALMDWVKKGGIMILGTGLRVDDTLGRYAPELLDDMYDKAYLKDVSLKISNKAERVANIYVLNLLIHGGNIIISDGELPLVSSVNKERGQIIVAAYDFIDLSPHLDENDEYIANLLTKSIGPTRLESIANELNMRDDNQYLDVKAVLSAPDLNKFPETSIFLLIILLSITISGPILFIILKNNNMLSVYTSILIVFSVLSTVFVFLIGNISRYKTTFYSYAVINDVNENYISKEIFVNLVNPYNRAYDVNVDKEYSYRDIGGNAYNPENAGSTDIITLTEGEDYKNIEFSKNKAFEGHVFRLEKKEDNPEQLGINGYINISKNKISGKLTNNYPFDLKDVSIFSYSKLVKLGDIKAKEEISLDDKELLNIPLNNTFLISAYLTSYDRLSQRGDISDKNISAYQRTNLLSFYIDNFLSGYTQDAGIIAFVDENTVEEEIVKNIPGQGISLYVSNLNVDNKNGDLIYRQALMKNPTVISGEYYMETNTYYTGTPLVLEYNLGTDVDIEEVIFEGVSDVLKENITDEFNGQIYLYDYEKESFVKKDVTQNTYTKGELAQYLTPENTIRVRYSSSDTGSSNMYLSLPMLAITARQK